MKTEYKIIADHLRSSCFLIADGVLPSNEGRGYVLRRIMRRSMRQLHKLGAQESSMFKFVDSLIAEMGSAFSELSRARDLIIETLKNEENQFRKTLGKGLKILDEEIENLQDKNILSGESAFKLYDTYGFPLDLTQDICKEKNITIDLDEFEKQMQQQKIRARKNWKGSGETSENQYLLKLQDEIDATKFLGYNQEEEKSKILAFLVNGKKQDSINDEDQKKEILVILQETPFYATSGGQKGDEGTLENNSGKIQIKITTKTGDLFLHKVKNFSGSFKSGEEVTAKINRENRLKIARNHSATHLMHKALKLVLGNSISQKGSNVDSNYFTFDFNFNRALEEKEIKEVENLVNFYIKQASDSKTEMMELEKAKESGAEALFGEKYNSWVRVVTFGKNQDGSPFSVELCGGTHVKNSNEIEIFKIIYEKSIASGIRRIEARTGEAAKEFLLTKLEKIYKENEEKLQKIKDLNSQIDIAFSNNASRGIISDQNGYFFESLDLKELKDNFNLEEINEKIAKAANYSQNKDQEIKKLNKELQNLRKKNLIANLDKISSEEISGTNFIFHHFENIEANDLREISNTLKNKHKNSVIFLLFASNQDKISALINISQDLTEKFDANILIKEVANFIGAKGGGGKKDMAMTGGNNKRGVENAIAKIKELIKN